MTTALGDRRPARAWSNSMRGGAVLLCAVCMACTGEESRMLDSGPDPEPLATAAPAARFSFSPTTGTSGTLFWMDPGASLDPDTPADSLRMRVDWEGDGGFDTGWLPLQALSHTYAPGSPRPLIQVRDPEGNTGETLRDLRVEVPVDQLEITADVRLTGFIEASTPDWMGMDGSLLLTLHNPTPWPISALSLDSLSLVLPSGELRASEFRLDAVQTAPGTWEGQLHAAESLQLEFQLSFLSSFPDTLIDCEAPQPMRLSFGMGSIGQRRTLDCDAALRCWYE
ncbi:MAG: hypothetical protein KC518_13520 [Candidatus Cloacimonetes bacterium]|nr:hypothetical protein [Candidatus Cloacimonadota bacterium]MCA9785478.1 hypothetical protein [Candidatus Cloacimonadota bacterium]